MQTKHLLPSVAIQPNLELKTRPKHLLGSHPLVITLPAVTNKQIYSQGNVRHARTTNRFHTVIIATLLQTRSLLYKLFYYGIFYVVIDYGGRHWKGSTIYNATEWPLMTKTFVLMNKNIFF